MVKAYSSDLRERVIHYLEKGHDKKSAADFFSVGIATIYRWVKQKKVTGNLAPKRRERTYQKIDNQRLKEYIEAHPEHFLREIAKEFSVTEQAIFYALKRLKITRKKRLLSIRKESLRKEQSSLKN